MITSTSKTLHQWARRIDTSVLTAPTFFSDLFRAREGWTTPKQSFVMDIIQDGNYAAEPQQRDGEGQGNRFNRGTQREIIPATYHEYYNLNVDDLQQREPGELALSEVEYGEQWLTGRALAKVSRWNSNILAKIQRGLEKQAIETLTTGQFQASDDIFEWGVLPGHFPTTATSWSDLVNSDPEADLVSLFDRIRQDSGRKIDTLVFGEAAFRNFKNNEKTRDLFKFTRPETFIDLNFMSSDSNGAKRVGSLVIGHNIVNAYVHDGTYKANNGDVTNYLAPDKVVAYYSGADWRRWATDIPQLLPADERVRAFSPGRVVLGDRGLSYHQFATVQGSEGMRIDIKSRMVFDPIENQTFGTLDTEI